MAFNKDEMHAPSWMDSAFFERVLRESEKDVSLTVSECKIVPGTKPGDHFASIIFRAAVSYTSRGKDCDVSLIVKTVPEQEGMKRDLLKDGSIFETETIMYQTVIPEMVQLLRSVGDDTEFGPRLLHSSKDPHVVMVFEDITKRDYQMKYSQLNLAEAKLFYTKLARWHATSMHLVDTLPVIKTLKKGVGNMEGDFQVIWTGHIAMLANLCKDWPGFEKYAERLEIFKDKIFGKLADVYTAKESNRINVLNHGDLHFKNMMYKMDEGVVKDVLLLDYQISIWGTPATDMLYSLYNICSVETRDAHRDELIQFYYDELVSTLNRVGYLRKIPTLLDLHIEILKNGHLETFLATTFLPFMVVSFEEMIPQQPENPEEGINVDFGDKKMMEQMMLHIYQHPNYTSVIKRYLPVLLHKGLLDF